MADTRLGWVAALAVLAHEIPHHMGDLVVLNHSSGNKRIALVKVSLAGAVTAIGGLAGYWLVNQLQDYLPYFLVMVSSSFIYVALADLIPQLQKRLAARQTLAQLAWLAAGMVLVTAMGTLSHELGHGHGHDHGEAAAGAHAPHDHDADHGHETPAPAASSPGA